MCKWMHTVEYLKPVLFKDQLYMVKVYLKSTGGNQSSKLCLSTGLPFGVTEFGLLHSPKPNQFQIVKKV